MSSTSSSLATANPRNFSVKRIMREWQEFQKAAEEKQNDYFHAEPLQDSMFEWHFTIRGPPDSDYAGGRYHGRILLPSQYPFKPPDIVMLTPSGRFEINKKICLSISSFHPNNWFPSWSIRTVLTALIAFMMTPAAGAIGSLEYSSHERKEYAARSSAYKCELCGHTNLELLPDLEPGVLERAGVPKLDKEVTDTIAANKAIAAVTTVSQPSTPAHGPTSVPATPINMEQAKRIAAGPSGPTSPVFIRSHSEPMHQQSSSSAAQEPATPVNAAAASSSSSSSVTSVITSSPLSPLVLDEGLRQRQGRVILPTTTTTTTTNAITEENKVASPAATIAQPVVPAPASAAIASPPPPVRIQLQQQQPHAHRLSSVTVFLSLLIVLILMRKLYASTQTKAEFNFDFSTD